jgi:hypothetical protein
MQVSDQEMARFSQGPHTSLPLRPTIPPAATSIMKKISLLQLHPMYLGGRYFIIGAEYICRMLAFSPCMYALKIQEAHGQ